jgi:hypothetical protein
MDKFSDEQKSKVWFPSFKLTRTITLIPMPIRQNTRNKIMQTVQYASTAVHMHLIAALESCFVYKSKQSRNV